MSRSAPVRAIRRRLLRLPVAIGVATIIESIHAVAQPAGPATVKIGVIGSGHIGGTVGGLWIRAGHPVFFSSRHPEELTDLVAGLGPLAQAGSVANAIAFGDAIFVAVPYAALPEIGRDFGGALHGRIVLDACNAIPARDGTISNEVEKNGIGVTSQKYLAGTRLVRAFNTLSYMILAREANRRAPRLAIPMAGDDPEAVRVAGDLVTDAGFEPVVVGKLVDAARFQRGAPGYGQVVTAAELRKTLSLPP